MCCDEGNFMYVGDGVVVVLDPACLVLQLLAWDLEPELDPHELGCPAIHSFIYM